MLLACKTFHSGSTLCVRQMQLECTEILRQIFVSLFAIMAQSLRNKYVESLDSRTPSRTLGIYRSFPTKSSYQTSLYTCSKTHNHKFRSPEGNNPTFPTSAHESNIYFPDICSSDTSPSQIFQLKEGKNQPLRLSQECKQETGCLEKCSTNEALDSLDRFHSRSFPSNDDLSCGIVVLPAYTKVCESWKSDKDIGSYINTSKLAPIIKWENLLTEDDEIDNIQDDSKLWKFYRSKVNFLDNYGINSPTSSHLSEPEQITSTLTYETHSIEPSKCFAAKKLYRSSCHFELQENNELIMTKGHTKEHPSSKIGGAYSDEQEEVVPKIFVSYDGGSYISRIHYYIDNANLSNKISSLSMHSHLAYSHENFQNPDGSQCFPVPYGLDVGNYERNGLKPTIGDRKTSSLADVGCMTEASHVNSIEDQKDVTPFDKIDATRSNKKDHGRVRLITEDKVLEWTPNSENFEIQIDRVSMTRSCDESFFGRTFKKFVNKRNMSLSEIISERSKSRLKFLESKMESIRNIGKKNLHDSKFLRAVGSLSKTRVKEIFEDGEHLKPDHRTSLPTVVIGSKKDFFPLGGPKRDEIKIRPKHKKETFDKSQGSSDEGSSGESQTDEANENRSSIDLKLRIQPSVSASEVTLFIDGVVNDEGKQRSISNSTKDGRHDFTKPRDAALRNTKSVTFALDTKSGSPVVQRHPNFSPEDWTCLPDISGNRQRKRWQSLTNENAESHADPGKDFQAFSLSKMKNFFLSYIKDVKETDNFCIENFNVKKSGNFFRKSKWKSSTARSYYVLHAICLIGMENLENIFRTQLPVTIKCHMETNSVSAPQTSENQSNCGTSLTLQEKSRPAKRPTTLEGLNKLENAENFSRAKYLSDGNLRKSKMWKHCNVSEKDVVQVEMFYRSHMTEVFVCKCSVILHFKVLKKRTFYRISSSLGEEVNDGKLQNVFFSSSNSSCSINEHLPSKEEEGRTSKSFSPSYSILGDPVFETEDEEGSCFCIHPQGDWKATKMGLLLLILDSGNNKRRSRRLSIALAEIGTGFTIWKDRIDHLSDYNICDSTFHSMRLSRDHNILAGFSFGDEAAASTFFSIIRDLRADGNDTLFNISRTTIEKRRPIFKSGTFSSIHPLFSKSDKSHPKSFLSKSTSSEKFLSVTYSESTKSCKKNLRKSEISGPCCFIHVGGVERSEMDGVLRRTNEDDFKIVPNKIVTLNYFEFTPKQKKLHSILKKTS